MWKKLLKYRVQAKEFHKILVKNGETTSFWYDNWSPLGRLADVLGPRGVIDLGISEEATVANALSRRRRRRHRQDILNQIESELDKLRDGSRTEDVAVWRSLDGSFKPIFATSATWEQIRCPDMAVNWYEGIWFSGASPKYSFQLWLATHNRLSTCDRMVSWNLGINPVCVLCHHSAETRDHLFFECQYSSRVWDRLTGNLLNVRYSASFTTILTMAADTSSPSSFRFLLRYVLQATLYSLWQERNKRRHGEVPISSDQLVSALNRLVRNRITSYNRLFPKKISDAFSLWISSCP